MSLHLQTRETSCGIFQIAPVGALDSATAPRLERALDLVLAAAPRTLILEMSGVEFISSMGVRAVLRARKEMARRGGKFLLLELTPPVERVFAIVNALPREEIFLNQNELDQYLAAMQKRVKAGEE